MGLRCGCDDDDEGNLAKWLETLPVKSIVLVALVDASQAHAARASAALAAIFPKDFKRTPPQSCRVAVVAGEKGQREPWQTMAAADFALSTVASTCLVRE